MYQSIRSFNILGHLNFWKIFVQIPPSSGRKAVQNCPIGSPFQVINNAPTPGNLPDYCFNFSVASVMLLKLCM